MISDVEISRDYCVSSNEALQFIMVQNNEDLAIRQFSFKPEFSHQQFGSKELILGYKNLSIKIFVASASLTLCVQISYDDKIDVVKHPKLPVPDDIDKILRKVLPPRHFRSVVAFEKHLQSAREELQFRPFGTLIYSYSQSNHCNNNSGGNGGDVTRLAGHGQQLQQQSQQQRQRHFQVFCVRGRELESAAFQEFHARMQIFLPFFIDGASFIDSEDPNWTVYLLYEQCASPSTAANGGGAGHDVSLDDSHEDNSHRNRDGQQVADAGNAHLFFVGFITAYRFYVPGARGGRLRLSQFLILPPFQRQGHGSRLLEAFYRDALTQSVLDVTVEDPALEFQLMRDFVDARNCLRELPELFDMQLDGADAIRRNISRRHVECARKTLCLNKYQTRRVFEILKFRATQPAQLRHFHEYLLNRLTWTYKINNRQRKQQNVESILEKEAQNLERQIKMECDELISNYEFVIKKLNKHVI